MGKGIRLQKYLAEAGIASRRAAENLIREGRVSLDGETVRALGTQVGTGPHEIRVDGKTVRRKEKLYVALHKPRRFVSTRDDPQDRRTVMDLLPREWRHIYPVGRLDYESEGLLLLTNDGELALRLTHPKHQVKKIYLVTVRGELSAAKLGRLRGGVWSEGERLTAHSVEIISENRSYTLVKMVLTTGKNQEIRRLMAEIGCEVVSLKRVQIGPLKLGELPAGKWRVLSRSEVSALLGVL